MKKQLYILFLIIIICQGCGKNFLEENPRSVLNPVSFYSTEEELNAGINAAYANLRQMYGETEHPFRLTLLSTDLFTNGKSQSGTPFDTYDPDHNSFSPEVNFVWSTCYKIINLTNTVIESAAAVQMNEQRKARIEAEAKFIRALSYFWLVQQFGDVPLKLDPTTRVITEASRDPKSEVLKVIVEDLKYAEANLAPTYPQWGRIRKGAAQHLLSKVYLVTQEWENAAELAKKVIDDNANFALLPSFAALFHHENQINKEIIFSIQYENDIVNSGSGNQTHLYFQNSYSDIPGMNRALQWGRPFTRFAPTDFLQSLYDEQKDQRWNIWRRFDDYYYNNAATIPPGKKVGDPVDEIWRNTVEFHPALIKYWDPTRPNVNEARGNKDFIVFRLGETYLIAAEALMMAGKVGEALTYFNTLRNRAAKPGVDFTISAGQLNIDTILDERARELAGEMHRWFDLARTGKTLERIKAYSKRGQDIQPHHVLRPIPQN